MGTLHSVISGKFCSSLNYKMESDSSKRVLRIYPRILFSNGKESKIFRYSFQQDKYLSSQIRQGGVLERSEGDLRLGWTGYCQSVFPVGVEKYFVRDQWNSWLLERDKVILGLRGAHEIKALPNGNFFINFGTTILGFSKTSALLDSSFQTLETFENCGYLCSDKRFLVLKKDKAGYAWGGLGPGLGILIYDMHTRKLKEVIKLSCLHTTAALLRTSSCPSGVRHPSGDSCLTYVDKEERTSYFFLYNISTSEKWEVGRTEDFFNIQGISDKVVFTESRKESMLWFPISYPTLPLRCLQEVYKRNITRICDGMFICNDNTVFRMENSKSGTHPEAVQFDKLETNANLKGFLYPTREEVREISKLLESAGVPVPIDIIDEILLFCVERI